MKMSVCIPTHQSPDSVDLLTRNLESLWDQSLQDFEIIVSDNSDNNRILDLCQWYGSIRYERNPIKGMAQNTNHALKRAEGELVKILFMDDFLAHDQALENIWSNFKGSWMVTGCEHTRDGVINSNPHYPTYNDQIYFGKNTIGSPSVLTMQRDKILYFDENMTWLLDCDLYRRLHDAFGEPTILNELGVVIGLHDSQMTHLIPDEVKLAEQEYIINKYTQ